MCWRRLASSKACLSTFFHTLARSACALAELPEPKPPSADIVPLKTREA
jgi:hypothetical protein